MFFCLCQSGEGSEIASTTRLGVDLSRIETIDAGFEFPDHGLSSVNYRRVRCDRLAAFAPSFPRAVLILFGKCLSVCRRFAAAAAFLIFFFAAALCFLVAMSQFLVKRSAACLGAHFIA